MEATMHRLAMPTLRAPDPRQNVILAALPDRDYRRLRPLLQWVDLPTGLRLHDAGRIETDLYFPTDGAVSRGCLTRSGESVEFALTGREGVVGVASFLSGEGMPTEATVVCAGHGYRLHADAIDRGPLRALLLAYVGDLIAQAGQAVVCNRFHSLEQRLCRWILSSLDRSSSNEIRTTHQLLAGLLGVRREGVSQVLAGLRNAGLVRSGRGRIAVLDRAGLETRACECYACLRRGRT